MSNNLNLTTIKKSVNFITRTNFISPQLLHNVLENNILLHG